jgi:hypothetical protein
MISMHVIPERLPFLLVQWGRWLENPKKQAVSWTNPVPRRPTVMDDKTREVVIAKVYIKSC